MRGCFGEMRGRADPPCSRKRTQEYKISMKKMRLDLAYMQIHGMDIVGPVVRDEVSDCSNAAKALLDRLFSP